MIAQCVCDTVESCLVGSVILPDTQDGVKKISLEEIDQTLLQSRTSSVVEVGGTLLS